MRKYVIMGVQGSGKGTQASKLCEAFGLEHIAWVTSSVGTSPTTPSSARRFVDSSTPATSSATTSSRVVRDRLEQHDWNHGFVVDGFPRNVPQAEFFLESYDIDAVIVLDLPDEEVERRVLSRRVCSQCGLDYNLIAHRPAVADVCDVCGGSLDQREDDTHEALARRLADYYAKTEPVIDVFGRKELVVRIDATPSKDEVFDAITDGLGLIQ